MGVSAARGSFASDSDSSHALAELLRRSRFEVLPLDGIEDEVLAHLTKDTKVTVTASPSRGLEASLDLSERLYTFNEVARTERWRRQTLERLAR